MAKQVSGGSYRKPKLGRILIIVIIVIVVLGFGRVRNFFGRYTGEVASDGTAFQEQTTVYDAESQETKLSDGTVVYIPDVEHLDFSSEHQKQDIPFGNAMENKSDNLYVKVGMTVQGHELLETGLLKPGQAVGEADLKAYFEPGRDYEATVRYTFYKKGSPTIDQIGDIKQKVTISVTGSSEYYDKKEGNLADEKGAEHEGETR